MKKYFKLLRVKHYFKNFIIFLPLFFNGSISVWDKLSDCLLGFAAFSLVSSAVYVINDIRDIERDRQHPVKKSRPLAQGSVSLKTAWILFVVFLLGGFAITAFAIGNLMSLVIIAAYFLFNFAYSFGVKNIPVADVVILMSGYLLRLVFGGIITDVEISSWLYLTTISVSFYMGFGKRRNELAKHSDSDTRKVLEFYTPEFLDKMTNAFLALSIAFYSLWTVVGTENRYLFWTVPVVMIMIMKYSLDIEKKDSEGDPIEVVLGDKALMLLGLFYAGLTAGILYLK